jgi:hypothetical protein
MPTTTCSCSAIGALGQILTEGGSSPRTFSDSSLRHEFIYETVGSTRGIQESRAINGTLNPLVSTARQKSYISQGAIALQASPIEIGRWRERIFGVPTGAEYISNVLPEFDILVYRENGIFRIYDAVVAQAVLRGKTSESAEGVEFIDLIVQIIGKEEEIDITDWPDPEPTIGTTAAYLPYVFWESDLTIDGDATEYEEFALIVNNMVDVRMNNKRFPSCVRSLGREITLEVKAPFTCTNLANSLLLHNETHDAVLTLATTGMSTEFNFRHVRNTFKTPTIPGKVHVPLEFRFKAFTASPAEGLVLIDHDDTP